MAVLAATALLARGGTNRGDDAGRYHDRAFAVCGVPDGVHILIDAPDRDRATTIVRLRGIRMADEGSAQVSHQDAGSAFIRNAVAESPVRIHLAPRRTRDADGALLAYVTIEATGESLNELLLGAGLASTDNRFEHPLLKRYGVLERRARGNRRAR